MRPIARRLPLVAANLAGAAAFAAPFLLSRPDGSAGGSEAGARAADAPWLLALLMPLLLAVAIAEAGEPGKGMDAKRVALLGVLACLAALLRLPLSLAGANLLFLLPILAGAVFGLSFGFLLGALAIAVSALITGGIGPWLPFQMWAAGWVGAGAALLRPAVERLRRRPRAAAVILAAYTYVAALFFGGVMNLYFWPVIVSDAATGWRPGLGLAETFRHYRAFYLLTSLAWDSIGGLVGAGVILAIGGPVLEMLHRYRRRFSVEVVPEDAAVVTARS
ncbi:MAG: ECF transporter S component [Actinomycetota bacterium]